MGSIKKKGTFQSSHHSVNHNPSGNIITDAAIEYFKTGESLDLFINNSTDIRDFVFVQQVAGGAKFKEEHVGKIVRFYWSNESEESLKYEKNENNVPLSENSVPLMDLPNTLPLDLDKVRYINKAIELVEKLAVPCFTGRNKRAFKYKEMGLAIVPFPHKGVTITKPGFDFSAVTAIGIQTGYRANTIALKNNLDSVPMSNELFPDTLIMGDWSFYEFCDKRYPGAMNAISKKFGYEIKYGGAIQMDELPQGLMIPFPEHLRDGIFNHMNKSQKVKVLDGQDWLL